MDVDSAGGISLNSICHYCFITEYYCGITLSTKEKNM
jgi:hypothetical protein